MSDALAGKRIVRAAAVQITPDFERPGGTLDRVCTAIDEAAAQGVRLIVFPETFVPYYPYFSFVRAPVASGADHMKLYEEAVVVPGPVTQAVAEHARLANMVVVLGVNERDHGSLYNTQLVFDTDGKLLLKRRKITPTFHERMIWGQGDAAGLKVVETGVGRVGALACWEHYNPLARYALMTQHEEIHCSQFPGSLVGPIFAEQIEVTIRHHALESGCFVVNATGWLTDAQIEAVTPDPNLQRALRGGCNTAIVSPEGQHLAEPLREGEGMVIADLDMALITKRKRMMDSVGHYARPELLSLAINDRPASPVTSFKDIENDERPREPAGIDPATDD
ncbi:Nitrilase/cyanide hydratase and apolipoprotein N-acyltransferase [Caballeronia novacaledonica]|uniref:Nitrilase/cyanide hydratase and apolipoprotein N-acyltransferase n=1 Tax=Caballeronia novacaledonica TaxID=1544861 RepID=A0A2U3I2U0_9BURK|nr:Nit6803 family nitrilase [Caballeronia novacaledonica]SPB14427.1 Nitrilase/cyanide hydratase and apolipoprotein N-acyltransferase [Caballeronia novacaledonica]